jgi:subtilisin family serine protease
MKKRASISLLIAFMAMLALAAFSACEDVFINKDTSRTDSQVLSGATERMTDQPETGPIERKYIVSFKERWQEVRSPQVADEVRVFTDQFLSETGIPADSVIARLEYVLRGFTARIDAEKAEALEEDARVDCVPHERNFKAISSFAVADTTDTTSSATTTSQTTPWGILRVGGPLDGTNKRAWILDTGIDLTHPDLNVDQTNSESFVNWDPIDGDTANDLHGHGTHVAGILAAKNNHRDVVGVAADARVVSVKVLDRFQGGTINSICQGVNHVVESLAPTSDVVNMSLRWPQPDQALDQCVTDAADEGFRIVVAAGNDDDDADNYSPARVVHDNVRTISAFREGDEFVQTFDWNTPNCNSNQDPNVGSNHGPPIAYSGPG